MKLVLSLYLAFLLSLFAQAAPGSGYAIEFDGVDDYVSIPNASNIFLSNTFSIEVWVKPENNATHTILSNGTAVQLSSLGFSFKTVAGTTQPKLRFRFNTVNYDSDDDALPLGEWSHCVVQLNSGSSTIDFYVNGVDRGSVAGIVAFSIAPGDLNFGRDLRSTSEYFDGELDELKVFDTEISLTAIRDYMCKKTTSSHPSYSDLTGYFKLDKGSGPTDVVNEIVTTPSTDGTLEDGTRVFSGVPLGDESTYIYDANTTPPNDNINLAHADGDDMTMQLTAGTADCMHIYLVNETPNKWDRSASLEVISYVRYWGTKMFGGSGTAKYDVTYNYDGHPGILNESLLTLGKRSANDELFWTTQEGIATLDEGLNELLLEDQTGTKFILGSSFGNYLPVTLNTFEVSVRNENVLLAWSTANEINSDYFILEHSTDGQHWNVLNMIDAAGFSTSELRYSFIDDNSRSGLQYYRLSLMNENGQLEVYGKETIFIDRPKVIQPNPNYGEFSATGIMKTELEEYVLLDLKGNQHALEKSYSNGICSFKFNGEAGIYQLVNLKKRELKPIRVVVLN